MKPILKQVILICKYFIFWLSFFWAAKAVFLLFNYSQSSKLPVSDLFNIFRHGLVMDVSTSCYILLLPALIAAFAPFLKPKPINSIIQVYTITIACIASFLLALDLKLYPHWGTRVNISAFNYIGDWVALSASISFIDAFSALLIIGALMAAFLYLYKKVFPLGIISSDKIGWYFMPLQLVFVAFLIIPIRGGVETSTLNLSSVAFSPNQYANQAACNYLWNFAKSVEKEKKLSNPCTYFTNEESVAHFDEFMNSDTTTCAPRLLRPNDGKQPNVILVILESFSNKVIASLGGLHDIAPNIDSLCKTSTVFTSFYGTGNRSDRGMSAIMGGYPSLLSTSIMVYPDKSSSLTLLPEYFNRKNYTTSFYYGGDINFYNLKAFILQSKCNKMITKDDFPSKLSQLSKWGVPDGYVFEKALTDLETEKEPFMKTIYTLSSHAPYDVPYSKIKGDTFEMQYLNSVAYTDSCLGHFINKLKESALWNNTLLIITSDHGHLEPGSTSITDGATYRIPLIWSGGVIDSAQQINIIAQQIDFSTTLLHQLGWETDESRFSRDFFKAHPYAFFMYDAGWSYIDNDGCFRFDQESKAFDQNPEGKFDHFVFPQAYMQVLHNDFIGR